MLPEGMLIQDERYPVGSNGLWHGGIHVIPDITFSESKKWIKPLFSGTVVAGKIQKSIHKDNYGGEEREYSTSYVLLKHNMKFKLDEDNKFFRLYFFQSLYALAAL